MRYPNIYTLFRERVEEYGGRHAFYVRRRGDWAGISWESFGREAHELAAALVAVGLRPGGSVCVLMGNVPEWPVCDLGAIMAGGVSVGLYPTSSAEQCRYIIDHADAEFVLVDTSAQLDKVLSVRAGLSKVKRIIALDEEAARGRAGALSYHEFLELGRKQEDQLRKMIVSRAERAQPDETVIMVYTSGTTGLPKGARLSHRYVINSVESLRGVVPLSDSDVTFSYLPYCHVAERIAGLYNRLHAGATAYFVDEPRRLWEYMLEIKPTVFASLPRFFEKIHARVVSDLEKSPAEEQREFAAALAVGREISQMRQAREPVPEQMANECADKCAPIVQRVNNYFGGRLRLATSGGAPLPQEIAEFFDACGLPILQAYGLTENVCVAFNRPDNYKFGTVGPPMPGCEVRLATDGEILVRSEMMFSGYYKALAQTAEMFDADDWLLTGDLGEIDADGFLKITGRKKELIITSTDKNVAPALIENLLKEHHLVSQAFLYGDGKSYLVALVTLNQIETEEYARAHGISSRDFAELTRDERIKSLVTQIVAQVNARVSSTESIKHFAILERDFSVEAEEVTPTLKVKRNVVAARYKDLLESLYA
ncbi:MAG: long-chain fatty acid--CoA ligase [Acidobacteriota bacterium]|nr:long-chain fatty acid--CoA ligase [Acidobacteriota bacterium]